VILASTVLMISSIASTAMANDKIVTSYQVEGWAGALQQLKGK